MKNLNWLFKKRGTPYDSILMLSGGKDSVLALHDILDSCETRVLAVTYDDGLLSPLALENVNTITKHFGLDSLILRNDIRAAVQSFLESSLVRTVDLNTFTEVFQGGFWKTVSDLAAAFGDVPVITGNIGYFSSEELLSAQWQQANDFISNLLGTRAPDVNATFVSYWAEEHYSVDTNLLEHLGWKSHGGLSTEQEELKAKREELNLAFPKDTLDDAIEWHWERVTRPRFGEPVQNE